MAKGSTLQNKQLLHASQMLYSTTVYLELNSGLEIGGLQNTIP
jgi:hypothetical protein